MARKKFPQARPPELDPEPVIPAPDAPPPQVVIPAEVIPAYDVAALNPYEANILRMAVQELTRRRSEALRLYHPLPSLEPFHASKVRTRLIRGSNRGGKTLGAAVEAARALTGQDPHGKYPKEDGVAFFFGLTEHHLGSVMYTKLFRAGAFDMIRDETTHEWRAFDPVKDLERKRDKKPAPPLIPQRFVKRIVWLKQGARIPKMIELKNGWEVYFFSSLGELPQGQKINFWWVDEEMKRQRLVEELFARCLDLAGVGVWSATPQAATVQFYDLHDKAAQGDPDVAEFDVKLVDNPYILQSEKDAFYNSLDEEARRVRFYGEFALSRLTVYPEFSRIVHAWDVSKYPIKANWSRWLGVDPGRQRCAVLFMGLPPPDEVKFKTAVFYDELYIPNCTAREFARQVALKSSGIVYEGGVIDMHEAAKHETGGGLTIKEQYERALEEAGVEFSGGGRPIFHWGSDDIMGGIETVKEWLRVQSNGHPYLHVVVQNLRWFQWEVERYRNKIDPETQQPTDKPHQKNNHLLDAARYLAMLDPKYRKPPPKKNSKPPAVRAMERKRDKDRGEDDSAGMIIRLSNWQRGDR